MAWEMAISERLKRWASSANVAAARHKRMVRNSKYHSARWLIVFTGLLLPQPDLFADTSTDLFQSWEISRSEYDRDLVDELDRQIEAEVYKQINSVIVIKDGKLLIERYYNGAGRDKTHNVRSVGKTFTSTILGIALSDGYVESIDQTLEDFYDLKGYENYDQKKSAVTLGHLVTMTSGFDGFDFDSESIGNEENMYPTPNWVQLTLNLPMAKDRNPGDEWAYFTAGIVVLGDILNSSVPGGLEVYADRKLFEPLDIRNYQWQHTPQRVVNTAGGIQLTPLGFAKFGQLYKNGGIWQGRQIVPAAWVAESLRPKLKAFDQYTYSYLWWHSQYEINGDVFPVAYCTGNGGNKIFVFPEHPLVVVVTASAFGKPYMHKQVDDLMESYVLPAVR